MFVSGRTGVLWRTFLVIQGSWRAILGDAVVTLDLQRGLRRFDGLGGLSAGASSRTLFDYAEPHRTQVLDLVCISKNIQNIPLIRGVYFPIVHYQNNETR